MQHKRISMAQYAFLRDVRDGVVSLKELIEKHALEEQRFSRWMRGTGFWRSLRAMIRESKRRRWVTLQMAGNVAAEKLAQAARGRVTLVPDDQALLERVVTVAQQAERERRAERRAARSAAGKRRLPSPDEDLCHPNAKDREDELLAILEGDADAAAGEAEEGA